jgi:hypothetical protein
VTGRVSVHNERGGRNACLGVDVQDGRLVAVRGERVRGRVVLAEVAEDAARSGRLPCVAALAVREGFARWVQAPFASFRKARRVLPTLLDIQLPFPMETCRHIVAGMERAENGNARALAVVARTDDVDRRLAVCREAGVDPRALDYEGLALWTQSLRERPPAAGDPALRIVVALSRDRAALAVGRGARFLGAHAAPGGEGAAIARLLRAHAAPEGEGALRVWTGVGAGDAEAVRRLDGALAADWPGPSWTPDRPGAFLARALATRALLDGPWPCNLRVGDRAHPAAARMERLGARRAAVAVLAAGLLLIGAAWTVGTLGARREAAVDRDFRNLANALAGYPVAARRGDAVRVAREETAARVAKRRPLDAVFEPSLLDVLAGVARTAGEWDLDIHAIALTRDAVTVQGTAAAWEGGERLSRRLGDAGYAVTLRRDEALADERIPFTVSSDETPE